MDGLRLRVVSFVAAALLVAPVSPGTGQEAVDAGSRPQLVMGDALIESMHGVEQVLHSPELREIVLRRDRPYEDSTFYDPTVILDGFRYRMWYRANFNAPPFYTGYAESLDGIHWTKPDLGLVEFNGSKNNNIVWPVPGGKGMTLSFFRDDNPNASAAERYKATGLASETVGGKSRAVLYGMVSPDGLRWRHVQEEPIVRAPLDDPAFDSHNIALWDGARRHYAIYARGWERHKVRDIRRFTSTDFRRWSAPTFLDFGSAPLEHLYKNAAVPYYRRPDTILMFPKRFVPDRNFDPKWPHKGLSDILFMWSGDGLRFDRRFMEAFIRPGRDPGNWHERAIEAGPTLVPTGSGEMSLYIVEHYRLEDVRIRRAVLRQDGFVSLHAGYKGGDAVTRALRFSGTRLLLNYSTSAAGSVRVELQDSAGRPLSGYRMEDCRTIFGDELVRTVTWQVGSDLGRLAGQVVRLKFELKDADLYSFQFE